MARITVPEADALLDQRIDVLDDGFVRLIDYMGSDARIVQAARVSYGAGTKSVREDAGLIDYLMRNRHTSPFEQVELTFHIRCPIFLARQWFRHRTASVNEISGRYSVLADAFYHPLASDLRLQSTLNKQGSEGKLPDDAGAEAAALIRKTHAESYQAYEKLLDLGVAREQSRGVLPASIYTEFYWKQDLHNLLHLIGLRLDGHAQQEIQAYAAVLARCVAAVAPATWNSYQNHMMHSTRLSSNEKTVVQQLIAGTAAVGDETLTERAWAELRRKLEI